VRALGAFLVAILLPKALVSCVVCLSLLSSACAQKSAGSRSNHEQTSRQRLASDRALAGVTDLVQFPSAQIEFIIGPQLRSGSSLNPIAWFDQTASTKGVEHGTRFPAAPPTHSLSGSISLVKGSRTVAGTNTTFRRDFAGAPYTFHILIRDAADIERDYIVSSVEDDTHLTISVPWEQSNAPSRSFAKSHADEYEQYVDLNYYDQALCQYVNYYRTGDARFLNYARKIADSWWKAPFLSEGNTDVSNSIAPRNSSLGGLMLRALDGRPEMWPWITKYVREQFETWVGLRVTYPAFYYGVRDPGYMLLYAANLAAVHPDEKVRAEFRQKALNAAVNYYARLQAPDGGFYFELDNVDKTTQPFQVGLLAEALIAVHRLTGDERVKQAILKSAEHQYTRCYNSRGWRGMYYFVGGKTKDKGESCEKGCGAAANSFPPADKGLIAEVRQLNGTTIHQFGYAFLISGDVKYRNWGDEIFDATYSGRDGYRGLAAGRAKEYDEAFRSAGKYLAWRLAHGASPDMLGKKSAAESATHSSLPAVSQPQSLRDVIAAALTEALRLAEIVPSEAEVDALLNQVTSATKDLSSRSDYSIDSFNELEAAANHLRNSLSILKEHGAIEDVKLRVGWAAARLKRAADKFYVK